MTGSETLGYDITTEVVDENADKEKEISDYIDTKINSDTEDLADSTLESLNKTQLGEFLAKEYFEVGAKSYGDIMNSKYLNFSLRAALQIIGDTETGRFIINGKTSSSETSSAETSDEDNKTIDEWLISRGGINNEPNEDMVKFLQQIVGVTVDGKPGAQTLWGVINKLGYSEANSIAEKVNTLYEGNETFQAIKIGEFSKGDKKYKYDQAKINIGQNNENQTIINNIQLTFDESGNITTTGFKIKNGWIVLDGGDASGTFALDQIKNNLSSSSNKDRVSASVNKDVFNQYTKELKQNFSGNGFLGAIKKYSEEDQERIKKILVSGWTDEQIANIVIETNSYQTDNPNIGVAMIASLKKGPRTSNGGVKYLFPTGPKSINLSEFISKNTNGGRVIDINKFYGKILDDAVQQAKKNEEKTAQLNIQNEMDKNKQILLKSIRGKEYEMNQLFPSLTDDRSIIYRAFFSIFEDQKVVIDNSSKYTYIEGDDLVFDLDQRKQEGHDRYQEIRFKLSEITDAKMNFNPEKFKTKLITEINNIIKKDFSIT